MNLDEPKVKETTDIRILLVEDNTINQRVAIAMLERMGYSVMLVENGQLALSAFKENNFDLIVMDCQMPVMDGYEATRQIRRYEMQPSDRDGVDSSRSIHIPIVAMTANAIKGDREKCIDAGMDDYIKKPITPEALRSVFERWIEQENSTPVPDKQVTEKAERLHNSVFDFAQLKIRMLDDESIARELVRAFIIDIPEQMIELNEAIASRDAAKLQFIAHTIKGISGNINAHKLQEAARKLEARSCDMKSDDFEDLHDPLKKEIRELCNMLAEYT